MGCFPRRSNGASVVPLDAQSARRLWPWQRQEHLPSFLDLSRFQVVKCLCFHFLVAWWRAILGPFFAQIFIINNGGPELTGAVCRRRRVSEKALQKIGKCSYRNL